MENEELLFTTEDGVGMFKGDKYYNVYTDSWKIQEGIAGVTYFDYSFKEKHTLRYSTKEKAEEYIVHNIPCLSINDIWQFVNGLEQDNHPLIKLIKSKLNLS